MLIDAAAPAPGGIAFKVLPPMPRLEVSVSGLPPTLLAGEVAQCTMRLRNSGAMTLQHLSMAAALGGGGAAVFLGGPPGGTAAAAAAAAGGAAVDGVAAAAAAQPAGGRGTPPSRSPRASLDGALLQLTASFRQGAAVFALPPAVRLGVGQELTLPVWCR